MTSNPTFWDRNSIDQFPWPDTSDAKLMKRMILPLIKNDSHQLIKNAKTDIYALSIDNLIMPVTLNEAELENSYVCSPYSHYVSYGYDFLKAHPKNRYLKPMIKGMDLLLQRADINRVIIVNNNLTSTNLYPNLNKQQIASITQYLTTKFPSHAILFRNIHASHPSFQLLKEVGYHLVPNREVYLTNTSENAAFRSRMFKSDLKILNKSDYRILEHEEIPLDAAPRLQELYNALNIEKYSRVNPQFTTNYFQEALQHQFLTFRALEKDGRIDGILGFYERDGVLTSPLFGYDTSLPQELGLYRKISALLLLEAQKKGLLLNHSGGAGKYKKLRRAKPEMEYLAVYTSHLPFKRRFLWNTLRRVMSSIGIRFMSE